MRLTWKRNATETGVCAVGESPRSSKLRSGENIYAVVSAIRSRGSVTGWYWVAGYDSDVPHKNTCQNPEATEADAKKAARSYVMEHLK